MRAVIPVAGIGERLKPHTLALPKPLIPVAGKPILSHIIDDLIEKGVEEFIFVIGYMGDKIRDFIQKNYRNVNCRFVKQERLLGLGYAIKLAIDNTDDSPILIILGDTVASFSMDDIKDRESNYLGVIQVEDARRFGVAEVHQDRVIGLEEKPEHPKSNLVLAGVYYISDVSKLKMALNELFQRNIMTNSEYQLTDALDLMLSSDVPFHWFKLGSWYDCGTFSYLLKTNRLLLEKNNRFPKELMKDNVIIPPVNISSSANIRNSIIGPFVSINTDCDIEKSIIENSIIGNNSTLYGCILTDSLIGDNASFFGRLNKLNLGNDSQIKYVDE